MSTLPPSRPNRASAPLQTEKKHQKLAFVVVVGEIVAFVVAEEPSGEWKTGEAASGGRQWEEQDWDSLRLILR